MITTTHQPVPSISILSGVGGRSTWQSTWPVDVTPVQSRRDRQAFIRFPQSVYREDRHWVAPLEAEVEAFIDPRRHPFYRHGIATQFLARSGQRVVGRILVSDDPHYNRAHGTNQGCFGMFESINDQHTANALLQAAANWLRHRGRTEIVGPVDYSTNYSCGLLVDGFDTVPRVMMNHQPPYYARLLENWGLTKAKDLYAWWFDCDNPTTINWDTRIERLSARFAGVIRPLCPKDMVADMQKVKAIYNSAWQDNWGFIKMTDAEFEAMAYQIQRLSGQVSAHLAEVNGQPVGVAIMLPDVNEAIKPLSGRLTTLGLPIGLGRLAWRMRKIRTGRLAVLGVVEGFRRRGVAELLIHQTYRHGVDVLKYDGAELGWTLEDNHLMNRAIERVGGQRYKTYRTYRKALATSSNGIPRVA